MLCLNHSPTRNVHCGGANNGTLSKYQNIIKILSKYQGLFTTLGNIIEILSKDYRNIIKIISN